MGHQAHFLRRLDRIATPQVDFALSLYRDHDFVRFLLDSVRIPEQEQCVAVSIGDPVRGPFLVMTREGRFITCLAEGMHPGHATLITRRQVDSVAARYLVLRRRLAAWDEVERQKGGSDRIIKRLFDNGDELCREELIALSAMVPGLRRTLHDVSKNSTHWQWGARERLVALMRRARKPGPRATSTLKLYHQHHWMLINLYVLLMVDVREEMPVHSTRYVESMAWLVSRTGFHTYSVGAAARGTHCIAALGKPALDFFKHQYASATTILGHAEAVLAITTLGLRHKGLRGAARRVLAGPAPTHECPVPSMNRYARWVNRLADVAFEEPETYARLHRDLGARRAVAASQARKAGFLARFERPEDVPEDLALPLATRSEADFLANPELVRDLFVMAPWLAQADAADLFVPQKHAAATHRRWTPERTLGLLGGFKMLRDRESAVRQAEDTGPARKAPCPCGSGEKYKRCCAKTAIVAAPQPEHEMAEAAE